MNDHASRRGQETNPPPRPVNVRRAVLEHLLLESRSNDERRRAIVEVAAKDRALFSELVGGTIRRRVTLDAVLSAYSSTRPDRMHDEVRAILHILAYEIVFLAHTKAFAAVNEAVDCVPAKLGDRTRGFVNAIGRKLAGSIKIVADDPATPRRAIATDPGRFVVFDRDVFPDPAKRPFEFLGALYGFTDEAIRILEKGRSRTDLERFLATTNERPATTLRARVGRTSPDELLRELQSAGAVVSMRPDGLIELDGGDPSVYEAFRTGRCTVQGPFAACVAPFVAPKPSERILDLCAAPGGKACHLAELAPSAKITAVSIHDHGARSIRENIARLGLTNVTVERWTREIDNLPVGPFDTVLLDVPCSNSAVLSRRPEARHALTKANLRELNAVQDRLLETAIRAKTATGRAPRIVYATCSILASEGKERVDAFLSAHPELRLLREIGHAPNSRFEDGGYAAEIAPL